MRAVVLDGATLNPGDNPWTQLEELAELVVYPRTSPSELHQRAVGAELLLTNKTPLDAATLAALPDLRFVSVLATGFNVVDVDAAADLGVAVSNVPEYASDTVAQHVFALLLELTNSVGAHDRAVRAGEWSRSEDFSFTCAPLVELAGLEMGIVGMGRIGSRVAQIAEALGMRVSAAARPSRPAGSGGAVIWRDVRDLFSHADVVSLHCPENEATRGLVDAEMLARMKPSAFLLNTSRGGLVDEPALVECLRQGGIAGAGIDVLSTEPPCDGSPLIGVPNLIVTPHVAWATLAARRRLMERTVQNVRAFLAGTPINLVTAA